MLHAVYEGRAGLRFRSVAGLVPALNTLWKRSVIVWGLEAPVFGRQRAFLFVSIIIISMFFAKKHGGFESKV